MIDGVAKLVRLALLLEDRLQLETLTLGTNEKVPSATCVAELCGANLSYTVAINDDLLVLLVGPEDQIELVLSIENCNKGWDTVFRLTRALEWSGRSNLEGRPFTIGPPTGHNSFVLAPPRAKGEELT